MSSHVVEEIKAQGSRPRSHVSARGSAFLTSGRCSYTPLAHACGIATNLVADPRAAYQYQDKPGSGAYSTSCQAGTDETM